MPRYIRKLNHDEMADLKNKLEIEKTHLLIIFTDDHEYGFNSFGGVFDNIESLVGIMHNLHPYGVALGVASPIPNWFLFGLGHDGQPQYPIARIELVLKNTLVEN